MSKFRRRYGVPSPEMEYLGHIDSHLLAGFGFGQAALQAQGAVQGEQITPKLAWMPEPGLAYQRLNRNVKNGHFVALLDGSDYAAQALPLAQFMRGNTGAKLTLLSTSHDYQSAGEFTGLPTPAGCRRLTQFDYHPLG